MFRLILWALLILLLIRALLRLTRGVLRGAGYTRGGGAPPAAVRLVKDPVCGVFVPPAGALTAGSGGDLQYFCSEKCRREWRKR